MLLVRIKCYILNNMKHNSTKLKQDISITYLYNQFGTNSVGAREIYNNKTIQVSGIISEIEIDHLERLYVILQDKYTPRQVVKDSLQCFISAQDVHKIKSSYQRKDAINLHGKINIQESLYDHIIIENCKIIS